MQICEERTESEELIWDTFDSIPQHTVSYEILNPGNGTFVLMINDECGDTCTTLEATINVKDLCQWGNEHFLVKNLGNDMMEFKLNY